MSTNNFLPSVAFTLAHEGGYSDNPRDPGGATNRGITLRTLAAWRHADCTAADVQALTEAEARAIYRASYWNAVHADALPAGLDLMVFDFGVNSGPGRSARVLQEALGVVADGAIGPQTLSAAARVPDMGALVGRIADAQETFYRSLDTFDAFGRGWLARLADRRGVALGMVG